MKYQVKEALDKIIENTPYKPEKLVVAKMIPNNIRILYKNDYDCEVAFQYSDGKLFLCADNDQLWAVCANQ